MNIRIHSLYQRLQAFYYLDENVVTLIGRGQNHCHYLQHERQVDISLSVTDVNATVDARLGNVEESVSEPQQTSQCHLTAASFKLQTPRTFRTTTNKTHA